MPASIHLEAIQLDPNSASQPQPAPLNLPTVMMNVQEKLDAIMESISSLNGSFASLSSDLQQVKTECSSNSNLISHLSNTVNSLSQQVACIQQQLYPPSQAQALASPSYSVPFKRQRTQSPVHGTLPFIPVPTNAPFLEYQPVHSQPTTTPHTPVQHQHPPTC